MAQSSTSFPVALVVALAGIEMVDWATAMLTQMSVKRNVASTKGCLQNKAPFLGKHLVVIDMDIGDLFIERQIF
jgi:hypothetical protein